MLAAWFTVTGPVQMPLAKGPDTVGVIVTGETPAAALKLTVPVNPESAAFVEL